MGKGQVSGHGKAPIAQSHQRQLSLKADEVQERLIKNKTLLNVVEPTLENTSLEVGFASDIKLSALGFGWMLDLII